MPVITPTQIANIGNNVKDTAQILSSPTPSDPLSSLGGDLDNVLKVIDKANELITNFMKLKNQFIPKPMTAPSGVQSFPLQNSPAQIPATNNAPVQQPAQIENKSPEVQKTLVEKKLSEAKISKFVEDILSVQAQRLPSEIKDTPLGDMVGVNFDKFQFKMGAIPIPKKMIIQQITNQLMKTIPNLYED